MKSAIVTCFKAFVSQVRENVVESARIMCINNGYQVTKVSKPKKAKKKVTKK